MIKPRARKRDGRTVYDVRLRDPEGNEYFRTFSTKREAQAFQDAQRADRRRGAWVDPRLAAKPFALLADDWLKSDPVKRPRSVARDQGILAKHIRPVLGQTPVGSITRTDVQRLVNHWATTYAARTVERMYAVLRAVMAEAETSELIGRTPCRGIKLPKAEEVYRPVLDADQVEDLVTALDDDQAVMMLVGIVLGLRWSECAGLTVGSLDFLRGELTVLRQLDAKGNLVVLKTRASRRTMAVPDWLITELSGVLGRRGLTGADHDALLFVTVTGAPLHYSNWRRRVWIPATEAAGLKGLQFHDLRSNAATAVVDEGINVKVTQARLGHTDVRTTLNIYARATTKADRHAATRMGKRFQPHRANVTKLRTDGPKAGDSPRSKRGVISARGVNAE